MKRIFDKQTKQTLRSMTFKERMDVVRRTSAYICQDEDYGEEPILDSVHKYIKDGTTDAGIVQMRFLTANEIVNRDVYAAELLVKEQIQYHNPVLRVTDCVTVKWILTTYLQEILKAAEYGDDECKMLLTEWFHYYEKRFTKQIPKRIAYKNDVELDGSAIRNPQRTIACTYLSMILYGTEVPQDVIIKMAQYRPRDQWPELSAIDTMQYHMHLVAKFDSIPYAYPRTHYDNGKAKKLKERIEQRRVSDREAIKKSLQTNLEEQARYYEKMAEQYHVELRQLQFANQEQQAEINQLQKQQELLEQKIDILVNELNYKENETHETDEEQPGVSEQDMQAYLQDCNIVLIGGIKSLVNRLQSIYPGWTYASHHSSVLVEKAVLQNADAVIFCTDCLTHKHYTGYIQYIRSNHIVHGYITNTNISIITSNIYSVLTGAKT